MSANADLSVSIAGTVLKNPVIAASGVFGSAETYARLFNVERIGGLCTKGLTLRPREGNRGRRLHETASGLINSIGLENPGVEAFIQNELPTLLKLGPAVIANLGGESIEDLAGGAKLLSASSVDMIELNISCPNIKAGGESFAIEPESAARAVAAVRRNCSKPLIVKLSPNARDIRSVASACVKEGADALSAVNTFNAMAIDIEKRAPVFDNITGGLSGPAVRPIALRVVWELCRTVKIPVIGIGGIDSSGAALEFMLAGARAVEVGSAAFARPSVLLEVVDGIGRYMKRRGIEEIEGLRIK